MNPRSYFMGLASKFKIFSSSEFFYLSVLFDGCILTHIFLFVNPIYQIIFFL